MERNVDRQTERKRDIKIDCARDKQRKTETESESGRGKREKKRERKQHIGCLVSDFEKSNQL